MSCTGCDSAFHLFKKEVGCESCGFAFCSKCCSKRSFVKNDVSVTQLICNKCFDSLGRERTQSTYSPPLAHKKRMAALGSRSMSLTTDVGRKTMLSSSWENEKDKEIAERLQKLKRERIKESPPSQMEIEERLAKLKGMDPSRYTAPPITVYRPSDKRSSTEQAVDLMKQMQEEVQIEARQINPEDEISARLTKLRGGAEVSSSEPENGPGAFQGVDHAEEQMDIEQESKIFAEQSGSLVTEAMKEVKSLEKDESYRSALQASKSRAAGEDSEELDEEEEANQVLEKLLSVNLEDPESLNGNQLQSPESESEKTALSEDQEFPWCIICTEDAKIRCFGCDGDLYCLKCFRECHDSLDIRDHKTCPFLCPKM